jgi:hypothetical protein
LHSAEKVVLATPAQRESARQSVWPLLFIVIITGLQAARLFRLVDRYATNIFFWDQWDFYSATLFQRHSLWQMFDWQHGPHRQGVGAVLSWIIEPLFRWNSRGEAFVAWVIFVLAALLALYLKKRLYGPLMYWDVAVPLIFLTPLEYESLFGSTNLSHGPLPILLLVIYCIGWSQRHAVLRYAWVLITNFLLIYTGFGFFVGMITPILLVLDYMRGKRAKLPTATAAAFLTALLVALASLGSFFIGYRFDPAAGCFQPFSLPISGYLHYVNLMFANFIGVRGAGALPTILGGVIVLWTCIALIALLRRLLAAREEGETSTLVTIALLMFSLIFCANTALGRLCLGVLTAQSSRYIPYVIPAFLGLYFSALAYRQKTSRAAGVAAVIAIAASASLVIRIGDRSMMAQYHRVKNDWRECYLQRHDIAQCDALTGNKIYPWPGTQLKDKLDYLEQNRLNLYATRD